MRCQLQPGASPNGPCFDCGHVISSHHYPTGLCVECVEVQLHRLDMQEDLQRRVDHLGRAVQFLTERIDNAQLDRLDAIASAWPKRTRTEHG